MASTITRPGSAPCCLSKQQLDKQSLPEKIKYPPSRHDVLQSQTPKSLSPSSCTSPLQSSSKNHGLQTYGNGMFQPRYVVSPTYQNGLIHANGQTPGNQWTGVQNYENLYLTRSTYDPNVRLLHQEEHSKPMLPPKKQTDYGKITRTVSNSRTSSSAEMDLSIFKGDNTILQVPRKVVTGQSSRNRAPLKVEEANELSSSFKSDEGDAQPRSTGGSLQIMDRSSRSVNESNAHVFQRVENDGWRSSGWSHQAGHHGWESPGWSDIRSFCRVLKYLMVLLVGFIVGAGVHALVKCWRKDSSKK